jgi:hypothetical protein
MKAFHVSGAVVLLMCFVAIGQPSRTAGKAFPEETTKKQTVALLNSS